MHQRTMVRRSSYRDRRDCCRVAVFGCRISFYHTADKLSQVSGINGEKTTMEKNKNHTSVVCGNPQIGALNEKGGRWRLALDSEEKKSSSENIEQIFGVAKKKGYPVFISPHARINKIPSVRIKQSTKVSPKCPEEKMAASENET